MAEIQLDRDKILELMNGFRPACALGAAAELEVWSVLAAGPLTAGQLAEKLTCDLRGLEMLLDAVAALGLLNKKDGKYAVPAALKTFLTADSPDTILPMLQHSTNTLRGWAELARVVKQGKPQPRVASIRGPEADRSAFIAAMHSVSAPAADGLIARLAPHTFKHLLDVGGASGTWTMAFLRAAPQAKATIFDLPDAIKQARDRLAGTEFAERVTLVAGDFYRDALPGGVDFAWVSAICHQHSRRENRALFAKVREALLPGGRIAIRDVVMRPDRVQPLGGAMFALNMLVNTDTGGTFTFAEYAEDLSAAGFREPRLLIEDTSGNVMNSVVAAQRPAA
jgi:SAM-dependent methyltransferase